MQGLVKRRVLIASDDGGLPGRGLPAITAVSKAPKTAAIWRTTPAVDITVTSQSGGRGQPSQDFDNQPHADAKHQPDDAHGEKAAYKDYLQPCTVGSANT